MVPNGNGADDNWKVHNDSAGESFGRINMATATDRLGQHLLRPAGARTSTRRTWRPRPSGWACRARSSPVPSLVLGTSPVSVLDMASGYSTLMDDGVHITPYIVSRVTDSSGQVLYQAPTSGTRVLSKNIADQTNWALSQVIAARHGHRRPVRPAGGGQDRHHREQHRRLVHRLHLLAHRLGVDGLPRRGETADEPTIGQNAYGGAYPATIWRKFMTAATQGLKSCPYDRPGQRRGQRHRLRHRHLVARHHGRFDRPPPGPARRPPRPRRWPRPPRRRPRRTDHDGDPDHGAPDHRRPAVIWLSDRQATVDARHLGAVAAAPLRCAVRA